MPDPKRQWLPQAAINAALKALPADAIDAVDASAVERMLLAALEHIDTSSTEELDSRSFAGRTLFRPYKSEKR